MLTSEQVTEYFKPQWRNLSTKTIRYNDGPFFDNHSDAHNFTTKLVSVWKDPSLEFRVMKVTIEFKDNQKITTETYYDVENLVRTSIDN